MSNAPGGLGVFELLFLKALPVVPQAKVLTALLIFRLLYLLIPLAFAIVIVILFERRKLNEALKRQDNGDNAASECRTAEKSVASKGASLS